MALLYSRKRIHLPKVCVYNTRSPQKQKRAKQASAIIIIMLIIVLLGVYLLKEIEPVFNKICSDKAKSIATIICNRQTSQCVKGYDYNDFFSVHKDANNQIVMLQANMVNINVLTSDIAEKVQEEIDKQQSDKIYIRAGNFTGMALLAGRGPKIPIRIATVGNVTTDVKSQFIQQGVNQTLHRLYLEVECEISILTPFNTIDDKIKNQFILAENIVVGKIPEAYYDIDGVEEGNILDTIQ